MTKKIFNFNSFVFKRKYSIFIASLFIIIVSLYIVLHGSVYIKATDIIDKSITVFYKQNDPKWADMNLGSSEFTMEDSGCLTTVIACALNMQDIKVKEPDSLTPGELCRYFSENNVYDSLGNILWESFEKSLNINAVIKSSNEITGAVIDKLLYYNIYPVAKVKILGVGSVHYVLITKSYDNEYWCIDPLNSKRELVPLSRFGNRIYALRYFTADY